MTRPWLCPRDATCPNKRAHDTYSAWRYGCHSGAARADKLRYDKQHEAGLHPHHLVPAGPYTRRLRCLAARGWRTDDIAEHSELGPAQIKKIMTGISSGITQRTAYHIDQVFEKLWWRDGPSSLAGVRARNRGWAVAGAFDDIDNMDEKPKLGKRSSGPTGHRGQVLDRRARCVRLTAEGKNLQQVAWAVGITERTVSRHLAAAAAEQQQQAEAA